MTIREAEAVRVGAFLAAGKPRRRPRRLSDAPTRTPPRRRQSAAAKERVAAFLAGRAPLVTDPVEARGVAAVVRNAADAAAEWGPEHLAAFRRELAFDSRGFR